MADFVFNVAKGRVRYYASLPAANDALIFVLLKASGLEADDVLIDHDDLASILAASNDECDFTNYARKTLTGVTITVNDTLDRLDIDADDLLYTSAGGATNNAIGKAVICYDPDTTTGTDADLVPLTAHDYVFTTTGADMPVEFHPSGWFGVR